MTKDERVALLRTQITEMVAISASEAGGLTEAEADHWWDELQEGVMDAFDGIVTDAASASEGEQA